MRMTSSSLAPAARKPYIPGALSEMYRSFDQSTRTEIDAEVDKVFVAKTGVRRKLDEKDVKDRLLVRQWLLIRDAVVAAWRFEQLEKRSNEQAELQAELLRSKLPAELEKRGLPEKVEGELLGKILNGAHLTVEVVHMSEIFADVWPHLVAEGLEVVGPIASVVGQPLSVIAGLMEIGEAHEVGDREAERNAFIHGFASHLVHGHIINALGSNSTLGCKQILGERAAMRFLAELPGDVRAKFLTRYRGPQRYVGENMNKALRDLGY